MLTSTEFLKYLLGVRFLVHRYLPPSIVIGTQLIYQEFCLPTHINFDIYMIWATTSLVFHYQQ